jgi:DNA-binding transcriptional LysR family regulator
MTPSRSDLADFLYFLAIARHRSFRQAGLEVGVSASALSHSLKALEARLGVRLFNRTNRSVTLTAAGTELAAAISRPFEEIGEAVEALNRYRESPAGRIRLNVVADAGPLVLNPVLPIFSERYPDIEVDVVASNRIVDVIEDGFDAGIRYGGTVPEDMIAVRLSSDFRWVVAAAPSYLARFGTPTSPQDLANHRCLGVRLGDDRIYRWEFQSGAEEYALSVPSRITADETRVLLGLALEGAGLMYAIEPIFSPHLEIGALRLVLEDHAVTGPGFHIYYPGRRQLPTALRLLIDVIREVHPAGR